MADHEFRLSKRESSSFVLIHSRRQVSGPSRRQLGTEHAAERRAPTWKLLTAPRQLVRDCRSRRGATSISSIVALRKRRHKR